MITQSNTCKTELDLAFQERHKVRREYNTARKFYFSERSSKYFLRPHLHRHNSVKMLVNDVGQELSAPKEILSECP